MWVRSLDSVLEWSIRDYTDPVLALALLIPSYMGLCHFCLWVSTQPCVCKGCLYWLLSSCFWAAFPALLQVFKIPVFHLLMCSLLWCRSTLLILLTQMWPLWTSWFLESWYGSEGIRNLGSFSLGDVVLPALSHQMLCYSLCWQAACRLHQLLYCFAKLWKQKVLSQKLNKPFSFLPPLKKQGTFKRSDVSPETRGHSSEEEPWPSKCRHLPLRPAERGSVLCGLWV